MWWLKTKTLLHGTSHCEPRQGYENIQALNGLHNWCYWSIVSIHIYETFSSIFDKLSYEDVMRKGYPLCGDSYHTRQHMRSAALLCFTIRWQYPCMYILPKKVCGRLAHTKRTYTYSIL